MKESFNNIVDKTNHLNGKLENLFEILPDSPKFYKLKKQTEGAYKFLKQALERHNDLISDSVPKIRSKSADFPKEFIETWNIYKDYMIEQHGMRMRSRMIKFRLELLLDLTDKDFKLATRWLRYYMSAGSPSIYPVNEFEIKENNTDGGKKGKAGFTIPTQQK